MDIQAILDGYSAWLKSEITVEKYNDFYEITTPYLDRFNDYLQIYVKQNENGQIFMTDDGYIIQNLKSSGMSLRKNSNRYNTMERIIKNYGLNLNGDDIETTTSISTFPQKKHMFVQAMMEIDDLYTTSEENVKNLFIEDVKAFFDKNKIYYSQDFTAVGKTGGIHRFDFHFQRTAKQPERFCNVLNNPREDSRNLIIFNWLDIKEKRSDPGNMIVIYNDDHKFDQEDATALDNYGIAHIPYGMLTSSVGLFQ